MHPPAPGAPLGAPRGASKDFKEKEREREREREREGEGEKEKESERERVSGRGDFPSIIMGALNLQASGHFIHSYFVAMPWAKAS